MAVTKSKQQKTRKKVKRTVADGIVHIKASFNNTLVQFTDRMGNVLCWETSGSSNFSGSRKGTPHAAKIATTGASIKAKDFGMKNVAVLVSGPGLGRESCIRELIDQGFKIIEITDVTPIPHNGCKPPKKRRV